MFRCQIERLINSNDMTHSSLRFRSQYLSDASTDDLTTLSIVKKRSLIWLIKRRRNPRRNAVKSHLESNVNDVLYGTIDPDPTLTVDFEA